jgi:hypothetical protein
MTPLFESTGTRLDDDVCEDYSDVSDMKDDENDEGMDENCVEQRTATILDDDGDDDIVFHICIQQMSLVL